MSFTISLWTVLAIQLFHFTKAPVISSVDYVRNILFTMAQWIIMFFAGDGDNIGVQSDEALVTDSYFGSRLGELVNGVATGTVYAADDQTLFIKEFHFPGSSYPYTFFQVGFTNFPDGTGLIVPDERGS